MAAAGIGPAVEVGTKVVEAAKAKLDEFANDPVYQSGKAARKWGMVSLGFGIVAALLGYVAQKADQSYLNDITNTLGIPQQGLATSAPPPPPPAPPQAPQIGFMNQIVYDVNSLGTSNASQNVAYLQNALGQLWGLSDYVYGATGGQVSGSPASQVPNQALGTQIAIAIMQTCTLIYELEGIPIPGNEVFSWEWWVSSQTGVYGGTPGEPLKVLQELTASAMLPYALHGEPDWTDALNMVSNVANADNYKITLNYLAQLLNASQPFDITQNPTGNQWGPLGSVMQDLSAVGIAIGNAAEAVGSDFEQFAKDAESFAGGVGAGLAVIAKGIINFPRLGFDAIGFTFWWGVDIVANAVWIPLVVIGAALVAYSVFALNVYPRIRTRLLVELKARTARIWAQFDARFHLLRKAKLVEADKEKEVVLETAAQTVAIEPQIATPPIIEGATAPEPQRSKPEEGGGAEFSAPGSAPHPDRPPGAPGPSDLTPPAPPVESTPTETTEALLGETGTKTPPPEPKVEPETSDKEPTDAELTIIETNRQETLPPTYRERRAQTERERSEAMLAQMNEVFA